MPKFHGGDQPFRRNLIVVLPYFWSKIAEEIKVVTGNTDHEDGKSKTKVDELNARFASAWTFVEKNYPILDTYYVLCIRFVWKNNEVCVQEGLDVIVSVFLLSRNII